MSHVALDVSPEHVKWDVGACDRFWSHLSSLRYAMFGGGCHHGMYCGWLYSNVINTPEYIDWVVGAWNCDYFWSELPNLRYALYGGECNVRASCGTSCLNLYCTPKVGGWAVGAS